MGEGREEVRKGEGQGGGRRGAREYDEGWEGRGRRKGEGWGGARVRRIRGAREEEGRGMGRS